MDGVLIKLIDGRYSLDGEIPIHAGDTLSIFFGDSWLETRMKNDGTCYYAENLEGICLTGLKAHLGG